jgi:hypothetical protein
MHLNCAAHHLEQRINSFYNPLPVGFVHYNSVFCHFVTYHQTLLARIWTLSTLLNRTNTTIYRPHSGFWNYCLGNEMTRSAVCFKLWIGMIIRNTMLFLMLGVIPRSKFPLTVMEDD